MSLTEACFVCLLFGRWFCVFGHNYIDAYRFTFSFRCNHLGYEKVILPLRAATYQFCFAASVWEV